MNIFYVHGAGATHRSFAYLSRELPHHHAEYFEYTIEESLDDCSTRLSREITKDCILIGHSLGGVIAGGVINHPNVKSLVTICSPFGGLPTATIMAMLRPDQLFRDMSPYNPNLYNIKKRLTLSTKPHLAIVGTSGLPFMIQKNDGAVSFESQTDIPSAKYKEFSLNHFEVLLSDDVANSIKEFLICLPLTS